MRQPTWTSHPSYSSPWSPPSWTWWAGCSALRPPVAAGWPAASGNCTSECFWRRSPASPRLSSFLSAPPSSQPGAPSVPSVLQNYRKQSVRRMIPFRITVANVAYLTNCSFNMFSYSFKFHIYIRNLHIKIMLIKVSIFCCQERLIYHSVLLQQLTWASRYTCKHRSWCGRRARRAGWATLPWARGKLAEGWRRAETSPEVLHHQSLLTEETVKHLILKNKHTDGGTMLGAGTAVRSVATALEMCKLCTFLKKSFS